jgi:hypothetical protein
MNERPPRWHARFMIQATGPGGAFTATMVDISAQGGRLLGIPVDTLTSGDQLTLRAAGLGMGAEVRWVRFDTCGMQFDRDLTPRELDLARRTAQRGNRRA